MLDIRIPERKYSARTSAGENDGQNIRRNRKRILIILLSITASIVENILLHMVRVQKGENIVAGNVT